MGYAIERVADRKTLGGVFFDSLPTVWQHEKTWHTGWKHDYSASALLNEIATRLSCAVFVVTEHVADYGKTYSRETRPAADWRYPEASRTVREFRDMISHWIEQEERLEVRMA